nr:MAG TPA: hypothetical protein [Caudoviricetes sp.]
MSRIKFKFNPFSIDHYIFKIFSISFISINRR